MLYCSVVLCSEVKCSVVWCSVVCSTQDTKFRIQSSRLKREGGGGEQWERRVGGGTWIVGEQGANIQGTLRLQKRGPSAL